MLDYLIGTIIAALSGMGVGGGGLLVLYLVYVKDIPQVEAQWINMIFFIFSAISALFCHAQKRKLNLKLSLILIILGIGGAFCGAILANTLKPEILRRIFGWLMLLSGIIVLLPKKRKK